MVITIITIIIPGGSDSDTTVVGCVGESFLSYEKRGVEAVSYTHLDVYKRQVVPLYNFGVPKNVGLHKIKLY